MLCPFCKEEMQEGRISTTTDPICFFEGDDKMPRFRARWHVPDKGVLLGSFDMFTGGLANAQYCPKCKKVIVDVE